MMSSHQTGGLECFTDSSNIQENIRIIRYPDQTVKAS